MDSIKDLDVDAMFTSDTEKTFQFQSELPSLPVPTLHHTLERYLDSVKPHVTPEEYRQTEFIVQQFASGVGKDLHAQLMEKAATSRNWLDQWWTDYAYMDFRLPISPSLNFVGCLPFFRHHLPPKDGTQIERAALVIHYFVKFWKMIRDERLKSEKDHRGQRFCMNQFHRAFSACRIPSQKRDHLNYYFATASEGPTPLHICVFCRGRVYTMKAVNENEQPLTAPEFQQQFQCIRDQCDQQPLGPSVALLTAGTRVKWAELRSRLISLHPRNHENLTKIQQSILTVVLDDESPVGECDTFRHALTGNPMNKWADKSISFIFYKNGMVACNFDHSPVDGMVHVTSVYYTDLCVRKCQGKWQGTKAVRKLDAPRELDFVLDSVIYQGIDSAKALYTTTARNLYFCIDPFDAYGKRYMSKVGFHPDTHMQLALQYAYYKMYNRPAPTYETGTTRKYYNARTETVRSCTVEAIDWCKAMLGTGNTDEVKFHLYKRASEKHKRIMAEATENKGCDRHLLGLQILALESGIPMPQIFTDPSYEKSGGGGNFILSTSLAGYTPVLGVVAPMRVDGYCCCYRIEPDSIGLIVTAWHTGGQTNPEQFHKMVRDCLMEMKELLDSSVTITAQL